MQILVDTDAQGYDGEAIASVPVGLGRYELLTCLLRVATTTCTSSRGTR